MQVRSRRLRCTEYSELALVYIQPSPIFPLPPFASPSPLRLPIQIHNLKHSTISSTLTTMHFTSIFVALALGAGESAALLLLPPVLVLFRLALTSFIRRLSVGCAFAAPAIHPRQEQGVPAAHLSKLPRPGPFTPDPFPHPPHHGARAVEQVNSADTTGAASGGQRKQALVGADSQFSLGPSPIDVPIPHN